MTSDLLTGTRIRLRSPEPGDIDLLYVWENDTSQWMVSNTLAPYSRFQIEQYVLGAQHDIFSEKQLRFMIEPVTPAGGQEPAGTVDLFEFDPVNSRAGVGILVCGQHRRKGYAREAMEILIRYSFSTLNLHQLFCNISPDNDASLHLFGDLGFVRCGIKLDWIREGKNWKEEWMFQLIRQDE
jgi:diamine N-acetyltransferase